MRPFHRLAVVNRGEAAMRLINAVRELNEQRPDPITLIALYTEPERQAMFVRQADEAYCLGPATVVGADGARRSGYLDYAALERALMAVRADAAWPGWGFVAEHPAFADLCEHLGVVFVGPGGDVMRRLGDKIEAKRLAEAAGVPVAPWSGGPVDTLAQATEHAAAIGFPLMIKAAAGGGGRGIRRVDSIDGLEEALAGARNEAAQAFGDGTVLMESLVTPARHVEVQVIADGAGNAWSLGVRDCSCQRRHQKVIEESASTALTAEQDAELREAARRLVLEAGYCNAGTVEFLYETRTGRLSFMEVNARLQVEHPVTEMVTGADLVKLQLHVAAGGTLEGEPPPTTGHAIEARLNAEDPELGFAPTPGRVQLLDLPSGPGLRIDRGVATGDAIPPEFDSMIAKVIAHGRDRPEAIARLRRALRDTVALLEDGTTNRSFLLGLLDRPEFRAGEFDTTWLDRLRLGGELKGPRNAEIALLQAVVELAGDQTAELRARFYALARRGRPQASADVGHTIEVVQRGHSYRFVVWQLAPRRYRLGLDGAAVEVEVESLGRFSRRLTLDGRSFTTLISRQGADLLVEVNGISHRIGRDEGGIVRSHGPAVVISIPVAPGDDVAAGDVVAVLESMKMETSLTAPFAGRVREIVAGANTHVGAHAPLLRLEALADAPPAASGERVSLTALDGGPPRPEGDRCVDDLRRLGWLVLGYELSDAEVERIIDDLNGACADPLGCSPHLIDEEHRLLELFADLRALARPHHEESDEILLRSPEEYLHAFLQSLDARDGSLPARFVELLRRALSHYGIAELDRTPELEDACFRIFLSQRRTAPVRAAVLAILDRRLERAEDLVGNVDERFRAVLDRLEEAAEGRDAAIAELARRLRHRYYDEPVIEAARDAVYGEMERNLAALAADPARADRSQLIDAVVRCPQVMAPMLTARMAGAAPALRRVLLEAMVGRFYRVRTLEPFEEVAAAGLPLALTHYVVDGRRHHLATAFVDLGALPDAVAALAAHAASVPADEVVVADIYAGGHGELLEPAAVAGRLGGLSPSVARVVVVVSEPGGRRGMAAVDVMTFRRAEDGELVHDERLRGIHPEMAERLHLWRLGEFDLERLPSPEDVYLLRGVGRANPRDERLFAIAEVRDLTAVRDADGGVIAIPELERMLREALEAMRDAQSGRPARERPLWNRVLLYAWPVIDFDPNELHAVVSRYARSTGALGIESLLVDGRLRERPDGPATPRVLRFSAPAGRGVVVEVDDPPREPLRPLDEGARRIVQARRRGSVHPVELVKLLAPAHDDRLRGLPRGEFVEHDLDADGRLSPVDRAPGLNDAGIVVGLVRNFTQRHPEGMLRVILLGDPTKALGSLAEPECARIIAALDLAERLAVPLEWFALSAGAKIAMDSGSENMDWVAAVLRRIVEFTQAGGEINVVVTGINVGAQPYWNAEATMLMHTRGVLVMTPESAMVLTGKQALDFAGGVSAEDNFGIGGYERIMGPNGQAQYWAPDLPAACALLLRCYEHGYVAPGERFPRRAATSDPAERDVRDAPHRAPGSELTRVGEIMSDTTNPARKLPFDIRSVMAAVADADHAPLERWAGMRDAEAAVVWDAHLGGWPVTLLGIESRPLARSGLIPADGPEEWTSGTLFPRSSKKIARAINAVGGRRPVVVLANLAGFDGSPESMREWQLEFGAEIGRAVVNARGPIVFCVVSRYHGGAFVVFSQRLNQRLEALAVEGAHASVIGGSAAAAVVFAREVDAQARRDARIAEADARIEAAQGADRQRLRAEREALWKTVRADTMRDFAARFDAVHSIERAVEVGSVSAIVPAQHLRPRLVDAVERGMRRTVEAEARGDGRHGVADPLAR